MRVTFQFNYSILIKIEFLKFFIVNGIVIFGSQYILIKTILIKGNTVIILILKQINKQPILTIFEKHYKIIKIFIEILCIIII